MASRYPVANVGVQVKVVKSVPSPAEAAVAYKAINEQIEALTRQKAELGCVLKNACLLDGGEECKITFDHHGVKISAKLVFCEKELFDLKAAKEVLDKKVLKPFLKKSSYDYVRVS